jgi:hypothetical protein
VLKFVKSVTITLGDHQPTPSTSLRQLQGRCTPDAKVVVALSLPLASQRRVVRDDHANKTGAQQFETWE